jgi:hypothetical protein
MQMRYKDYTKKDNKEFTIKTACCLPGTALKAAVAKVKLTPFDVFASSFE